MHALAVFMVLLAVYARLVGATIKDGGDAINVVGQYDWSKTTLTPSYTSGSPNGAGRIFLDRPVPAFDAIHDRLFVLDSGNNRVLVYDVNPDGTMPDPVAEHVLGQPDFHTLTPGCAADKLTTSSGSGLQADLAYDPVGDRLFVLDAENHRVVVFDTADIVDGEPAVSVLGKASLSACTGTPGVAAQTISRGMGLAYDPDHQHLFVTQGAGGGNRVSVFDVSSISDNENAVAVIGQTTFSASTAATTQVGLSDPGDAVYDEGNDRLFVLDAGANRVMVYDGNAIATGMAATNVIGQVSFTEGAGGLARNKIADAGSLAYDETNDRLFVGSGNGEAADGNRVRVFSVASIVNGQNADFTLIAPDFSSSPANAVTQYGTSGVGRMAIDTDHNFLYLGDLGNRRVLVFDVNAVSGAENAIYVLGQAAIDYTTARAFSPNRVGLSSPQGVAMDAVDHRLFISDTENDRVLGYNLSVDNVLGDYDPDFVLGQPSFGAFAASSAEDGMDGPTGLLYHDATDRLYVADSGNRRVLVFDVAAISNGEHAVTAFGQGQEVSAFALDEAGSRLFVSGGDRVRVYDVASVSSGQEPVNVLDVPGARGIAYDAEGQRLFVGSSTTHRVLVYGAESIGEGKPAMKVLGQDRLSSAGLPATAQDRLHAPHGLAFDPVGDRLLVADSGNNRVVVYDTAVINNGEKAVNVLGQATFGTSVPGTTISTLRAPTALALNDAGTVLLVADAGNNRVVFHDVEEGNPPPTLGAISPTTVTAGADVMLTVEGSDFVPGSTVRIAGGERATTFVNADRLTVQIPAADIAVGGPYEIIVQNPAPGGGTSSVQTLMVTNPAPVTTAVSPSVMSVGSAGFTLTVDGTGLTPNSTVRWNGSPRATVYVSSTRLTAAIADDDIPFADTFLVTVANEAPGGGVSNPQMFTVDHPTPVLAEISPAMKIVGSSEFVLSVDGSNFVPASVIRWNGIDRATTYVNDGRLTAAVPASDVAALGTVTITVFTPAPGGGSSAGRVFTVGGISIGDARPAASP